jgi:hypothetical protein
MDLAWDIAVLVVGVGLTGLGAITCFRSSTDSFSNPTAGLIAGIFLTLLGLAVLIGEGFIFGWIPHA